MPIDTDSEEWENAKTRDPLLVEIRSLLSGGENQAFSIDEIETHLSENYPHLFPPALVGEDAGPEAKVARQSVVVNILLERYWHSEFSFRYVTGDNGAEPGLYFTYDGLGINPVAEIDSVTDPYPDSSGGVLTGRFRDIERNVDEQISDLKGRINNLEHRIHHELEY
jgi:hypothetical protein